MNLQFTRRLWRTRTPPRQTVFPEPKPARPQKEQKHYKRASTSTCASFHSLLLLLLLRYCSHAWRGVVLIDEGPDLRHHIMLATRVSPERFFRPYGSPNCFASNHF